MFITWSTLTECHRAAYVILPLSSLDKPVTLPKKAALEFRLTWGMMYCTQTKAWTIRSCCQTPWWWCPSNPDPPDLLWSLRRCLAIPDWKRAWGFIRSTGTIWAYRWLMVWSWQLTDFSSNKSQRWDATAECFVSRMRTGETLTAMCVCVWVSMCLWLYVCLYVCLVLCTSPRKYRVVDADGTIKPRCCIDMSVASSLNDKLCLLLLLFDDDRQSYVLLLLLLLLMTFIRHKLRQRSKCAKSAVGR